MSTASSAPLSTTGRSKLFLNGLREPNFDLRWLTCQARFAPPYKAAKLES
jgi:hypothetical protein